MHTPSDEKDKNTIETLYAKLEKVHGSGSQHYINLRLNDFNAKAGKEDYEPTIKNHSLISFI